MAAQYGYVDFYRSRFGFLITFFGILILAGVSFGLTTGVTRVIVIFILLAILIASFFYEFYLSNNPVIEVAQDSVAIKEIYHPIIKWRFIYKSHFLGLNNIVHITIQKGKDGNPRHMIIKYFTGTQTREVQINKRDISDFGSFVKLMVDRTPGVIKDYA